MAPPFYALSYETTGCILSFCQLDRRDLSKTGAVAALLDELVGDTLELSLALKAPGFSVVPSIKIKKTQLRLDEVTVSDVTKFIMQPQAFVLDLSDPLAKAGDGKLKSLLETPATPTYVLRSGTAVPPANTFRVHFASEVASDTDYFAIIDGVLQSPVHVSAPHQGFQDIDFPFVSTKDTWHSVMFVSRGVQPFFDFLKSE